jgi:hypothetical protein
MAPLVPDLILEPRCVQGHLNAGYAITLLAASARRGVTLSSNVAGKSPQNMGKSSDMGKPWETKSI